MLKLVIKLNENFTFSNTQIIHILLQFEHCKTKQN